MAPEESKSLQTDKVGKSHSYDSDVEVFQMRFKEAEGEHFSISAWELAASIQGVAGLAEQMAKKGTFGEGIQPEVQVRPMKEGSFVLEFIVPAVVEHGVDVAFGALSAGGVLFYNHIKAGINNIKGVRVTDFEPLEGTDFIKATWQDGEATQVHKDMWAEFQKMSKRTRENLEKMMAPLGSSAEAVELRTGTTDEDAEEIMESEPIATIDAHEYREVITAPVEVSEEEKEFTAEAKFESIDFKEGGKWRIASTAGRRTVTIEDDNFLSLLDSGLKIGKDDLYEVTIKETRTTRAGRTTTSWVLTNIRRTKKGEGETLN